MLERRSLNLPTPDQLGAGRRFTSWRPDLAEFLEEHSIPEPNTGCVLWVGALTSRGYGNIQVAADWWAPAHVAAYVLRYGPVPAGLVLDHMCRVRSCINPDHLEPVSHRINILRGAAPSARLHRAGQCSKGHVFDQQNTWRDPKTGKQHCRACDAARHRAYRRRAA